jgi:alpha-glucosidase
MGGDMPIPEPPPESSTDQPTDRPPADWWKRAVVYQIYIRSFADANGDGVGDIAGIRSRLGYLRDLGANAVWITPWYRSPMADGGYDVADYRAIDPLFGSLDDAARLIAEAHGLGIRVIVDLVPNHTSSEHRWFREAVGSPRGSAARDRYLFRDGRGPGGTQPPNNWSSIFGGRAWTPAPDDGLEPRQWYLHLFDSSQPDLNWDNAEVRAEFESILDFWLDFGVDGFRIDVASFLVKAPGLPDLSDAGLGNPAADAEPGSHPYMDLESVHEIYRAWRQRVARAGRDVIFCGEIALPADRIARYLGPEELHTAFNLDFALRPWDAGQLSAAIDATLASHTAAGAPPTWVLGNHDLPRPSFKYGRSPDEEPWIAWERRGSPDQTRGLARARAAALLYLALPGAAYVYQGEELGLPEVLDLPPEARQDPTFRRSGGADVGRDGCRIPMPWSGSRPPFGFGPEGSHPWLPQPASWASLSVEAESADPRSTLALYRAALAIRRDHPDLAGDEFHWLRSPAGTLVFRRGDKFGCAVNLSAEAMPLPDGVRVLLASSPVREGMLGPDSAAWFEVPAESAVAGR